MARELTEADRAAWAGYAQVVKPLPGHARAELPAGFEPIAAAAVPARRDSVSTRARVLPLAISIGAHPPGVDRATWQRFRSGKLPPARRLDLHGHTAQHAFHALIGFLRTAHADRLRCVEVITGRGTLEVGVIRREFPLWLNLPEIRPLVLAAAHPHAANPGSVRLLLRRIR
ncbi:MAG TPA: Smr/MutS family protein [Acetobacteraceae bacterium]|nr:Smr/MutS family protein [Acetobacteraceae bacterium]